MKTKKEIQDRMNKKIILKVYARRDEETGEVGADWDFPHQIGTFSMIGILQTIIHDLNVSQDEAGLREEDE